MLSGAWKIDGATLVANVMEIIKGLLGIIVKVLTDQPEPQGEFLRLVPEAMRSLVSCLLSIGPILVVFPLLFALATLVERKGLGRIQNRYGPNRVGPWGLLQPIADGLKMLIKEDIVPRAADRVVHFLAPIALLVPVFLSFAVLPLGRHLVALDLSAGLLFFFAAGATTEVAIFMAGWGSRNKYSLLGAMRAIAQMISYELPLVISAVTVVMLTGSLSLVRIVEAQQGSLLDWNVCRPWGLAGFLLFLTAAVAEANRSPFDIPEGESEIIAGHMVEYSGFKYALFFLGEYLEMFAVSGLAITLFLGGYHAPFGFLAWVPSYGWFFLKLAGLIALFIWLRGTLPRMRVDQLMKLAWQFILPMALLNIFVAALWHFSAAWALPGGTLSRWVLCLVLLGVPYWVLGRAVAPATGRRTYRFAE
jgi:NADH-quinone oxidoreductase subunit H